MQGLLTRSESKVFRSHVVTLPRDDPDRARCNRSALGDHQKYHDQEQGTRLNERIKFQQMAGILNETLDQTRSEVGIY